MRIGIFLILVSLPLQSFANDDMVATIGFTLGGSTVVEENGFGFYSSNTKSELNAGDGIQTEIGYELGVTDNTAVRLLIGSKFNASDFGGVTHKINSNPASALYLVTARRVSFGGGLTYHINPRYIARGQYNSQFDETATFDNALGFSLLLDIRLTPSQLFALDIRYTNITYRSAPPPTTLNPSSSQRSKTSYNASNIGLFAMFKF